MDAAEIAQWNKEVKLRRGEKGGMVEASSAPSPDAIPPPEQRA
jgi:hypothetical protein